MPLDSLPTENVPLLGVHSSVTGRFWRQRPVSRRAADLAVQQHGIDALLADVVVGRGVSPDELESFLSPSLKRQLPDPSVLMEMDGAAARLADAVIRRETIGIFGDYDVDGTTASALLSRYLREVGVEPLVHLPDRFTEGYGPSAAGLASLEQRGATLIVTVDCGSNHGALLEPLDADVMVLDHHKMSDRPEVAHLINPQRPGDQSGLGGLSAGGIAFMALVALNRELRRRQYFGPGQEPKLVQYLDLVALSLIADVMPLQGLTRTLVSQGLKLIGDWQNAETGNPGLRSLAQVAGLQGLPLASHLGFQIGPRINAAGRIGHAKVAFDLLMTDEPARANAIAQKLEALNKERRRLEERVRREAAAQISDDENMSSSAVLIAAAEDWHPGVIGIVAGRLKERFDRPCLVIALQNGEGVGSGRSVPGVDLGDAISKAAREGIIEAGGGHAQAAGFRLRADQVSPLKEFLDAELRQEVDQAGMNNALVLDGAIGLGSVHGSTCQALGPAGPFGHGNPEPRFALADVRVRQARVVGERHLSVTLDDGLGRTARAIAFGVVDEPLGTVLQDPSRPSLHFAGRITPDTWRGGDAAQLEIDDVAIPADNSLKS